MTEWSPSEEQNQGQIYRSYEIVHEEIEQLQKRLNCPDQFINDFLEATRDYYATNNCFGKRRHNRSKNSDI